MLITLIQFELFCVACTCFWYGGVLGYDHIIWHPEREVITWEKKNWMRK